MDKFQKILIADDHALVRRGLRQVLETRPSIRVIEAENGEEALHMIRQEKPQVALLDIEMPKMTGFDVAVRVQNESLPVTLVFLTMFKEEHVFNKAMDVGVKGYVLKENTIAEILQCIQAVTAGKYYLSPSISDFLVRRNAKLVTPASDATGVGLLTPAERNLLKLLAEMKTNQQIADALHISIKTVHNHRNNICDKLGLQGAHALLKFAVEHVSQL
ncbi:MAG: response regulator transcription factor [Bacteroidota bacterium]|nr:response regulator transcription factor [Bacteroidota bacterium]